MSASPKLLDLHDRLEVDDGRELVVPRELDCDVAGVVGQRNARVGQRQNAPSDLKRLAHQVAVGVGGAGCCLEVDIVEGAVHGQDPVQAGGLLEEYRGDVLAEHAALDRGHSAPTFGLC